MPRPEYKVEGYNERQPGYDAPYHGTADYDPEFVHAYGGDPKSQAQYQKDLEALAGVTHVVEEPEVKTPEVKTPEVKTPSS